MNQVPDELVDAARDGDRRALEQVVAAVQDDVHRLALRMTGCPDDALDATQEILVKVVTRLASFRGEAKLTTWVHRIGVNHLLDRKRSTVERFETTFSSFADDLVDGLAPAALAEPELDLLAREVKQGCTLALLTCLDRDARVAYVLGEVFEVSADEGAWICEISPAAYRKRLSRARAAVRKFLGNNCGMVAPDSAACRCSSRVDVAVRLGRVDPSIATTATAVELDAAVEEMERLYDAAALMRSTRDHPAPAEVGTRIRAILDTTRGPIV